MDNTKRKNGILLNNKRRKNNINKDSKKKKLFLFFIFLHAIFVLTVGFFFTFVIPAKFNNYGIRNTSVYDKIKYIFTGEFPRDTDDQKEYEENKEEIYRTYNNSSDYFDNSNLN